MATAKVQNAIAALVTETKETTVINVLEKFKTYLSKKIDIDSDFVGYFDDFKSIYMTDMKEEDAAAKKLLKKGKVPAAAKPKGTRKPSLMNLYISLKMAQLKEEGAVGNTMKEAIASWNEVKLDDNDILMIKAKADLAALGVPSGDVDAKREIDDAAPLEPEVPICGKPKQPRGKGKAAKC